MRCSAVVSIFNVGGRMLLAAMLLLTAVQEERWVFTGRDDFWEQVEVDRQSVRRFGDRVRIWERRRMVLNQGSILREIDIDCRERTWTVFSNKFTDANGAQRHFRFDEFRRTADAIEPGSLDENTFNVVCG